MEIAFNFLIDFYRHRLTSTFIWSCYCFFLTRHYNLNQMFIGIATENKKEI